MKSGDAKRRQSGLPPWLLLLIVPWLASPAAACRAACSDPLRALSDPVEGAEVSTLFIGEVVGVRNTARLQDLAKCHPRPTDQEGERLECIERFGQTFEVEIFPAEILSGSSDSPAIVTLSDCSRQAPLLGTQVLAATFDDGRVTVLAEERGAPDLPGYDRTFDSAYLQQIHDCLAGQCPTRPTDDWTHGENR